MGCKVGREGKWKKEKRCDDGESRNGGEKEEKKLKDERKVEKKKKKLTPEEEACSSGYVHVRARRGQATDSHSLAERVRREKISERMRHLQSLVPGCDKIKGKALVLDEIINYVQSLQNQVEFLVRKLASVEFLFFGEFNPNSAESEMTTTMTKMEPISPSLFLLHDDTSILFSQDDGYILDEKRENLNGPNGFSNLGSF